MGSACTSSRSTKVHPVRIAVVPEASNVRVPSATATSQAPAKQIAVQGILAGQISEEPAAIACPTSETVVLAQPKRKPSLIKAVKENNLELIDQLLEEGANIETLGMWDNTPLLAACTYGHSEAALRLLFCGADVTKRNENGATALHYAAVEGAPSVVEAIILAARKQGGDETVHRVVNCGTAGIYNRHLDIYAMRTPLGFAAESGFLDVVSALVSAKANLESHSEAGRTALWLACRSARADVVRLLLSHGADTSAKDGEGLSPLEAATSGSCQEDIVSALLTHGVANVNDTAGSPLRDAVKAGKRGVAESLLTQGAAAQPRCGGSLPLHAACERGDEELISMLLRASADSSSRDANGLTAVDLLRQRRMDDGRIVALLSVGQRDPMGGLDGSTGGAGEAGEAEKAVQEEIAVPKLHAQSQEADPNHMEAES
mmetsp:Transcript_66770/g.145657  ORF Transcript_66770/g.145657 Transcript_66770/m.145657 type:complete len:432 (-) Transcript_66770:111-1406(-)